MVGVSLGEHPYATFGKANASQIVGGKKGLHIVKNYPNVLGTWAMRG